jgi:signal transduction histidine kinase
VNESQYRELLAVGRRLVQELDSEGVLHQVLEVARDVTGARYAALGVLGADRASLRRFLVSGVDEATQQQIGELPHGRGVLGELIRRPEPLRLASVGEHPRSYGFPPGHPPMETFLGAPVLIRGEAFGNIYLTDKAGGEPFSEDDEEALVVLADWAAVAIENARLHERLSTDRDELERAVSTLTATTSIARALAGETDLARVLELIAKRGRAVVEARVLFIALLEGDALRVAAGAGEVPDGYRDARIALADTVSGEVVRTGRPRRLNDLNRDRFERSTLGRLGLTPGCGLFVPLLHRQQTIGVIIALDRSTEGDYTEDDLRLLEAFAVSAATAVGTAQTVTIEQRRRSVQATEGERRRWARELHDETLQELAVIRLGLAAGAKADDPDQLRDAMRRAVGEIDQRIAALRRLIADLRPASLDQLGIGPALEDLVERMASRGLEVALDLDLDWEAGREPRRMTGEVEDTVYRLVQEALNNVTKHAQAARVDVSVLERDGRVEISVRDDGRGFDPTAATAGFGVTGMRERAELAGGTLEVRSAPGEGTEVRASLPVRRRAEEPAPATSAA